MYMQFTGYLVNLFAILLNPLTNFLKYKKIFF
jgi:hypothetical protein